MCGRFTLTSNGKAIAQSFQLSQVPNLEPRYNIAPTQSVATIVQEQGQARQLRLMKWGLIPSWAKDPKIGHRLINARAETLTEKPSWRNAFKRRRCLIIADGFYEWYKQGKSKQPYYVHFKDKRIFAFAGLWERWQSQEGESIVSCSIITTEANELMKPIHHRMPALLLPDVYNQWLDSALAATSEIQTLLKPWENEGMEIYRVSSAVNRPTNDYPECLAPIDAENPSTNS